MKLVISIVWILWATQLMGQGALNCINSNHKLRGYFYAGTSIRDSSALGMFWASSNRPREIKNLEYETGKLIVRIIQDDTSAFYTEDGRKWKGTAVLVLNGTDSVAGFDAQDSRLNMVCEAFFEQKWIEIEYLASSWCGHSYHKVFLGKNQYWRFTSPCYTGDTPAKLRFKLTVSGGKIVYSNEIDGAFNPKSLSNKQGHKRKNFMDPYNN